MMVVDGSGEFMGINEQSDWRIVKNDRSFVNQIAISLSLLWRRQSQWIDRRFCARN